MWRHSLLAALLLVVMFPISISAQRAAGPKQRGDRIIAAVRAVLDAQVAAWNRGDVEGYMDGYWRSGENAFFFGDSLTRGRRNMRAPCQKKYDTPAKIGTATHSHLGMTSI